MVDHCSKGVYHRAILPCHFIIVATIGVVIPRLIMKLFADSAITSTEEDLPLVLRQHYVYPTISMVIFLFGQAFKKTVQVPESMHPGIRIKRILYAYYAMNVILQGIGLWLGRPFTDSAQCVSKDVDDLFLFFDNRKQYKALCPYPSMMCLSTNNAMIILPSCLYAGFVVWLSHAHVLPCLQSNLNRVQSHIDTSMQVIFNSSGRDNTLNGRGFFAGILFLSRVLLMYGTISDNLKVNKCVEPIEDGRPYSWPYFILNQMYYYTLWEGWISSGILLKDSLRSMVRLATSIKDGQPNLLGCLSCDHVIRVPGFFGESIRNNVALTGDEKISSSQDDGFNGGLSATVEAKNRAA